MNKLGDLGGKLGQIGKTVGKGIAEETKKTAKATAQQIGLEAVGEIKEGDEKKGEVPQQQEQQIVQKQESTNEIVNSLYGVKAKTEEDKNKETMASLAEENPTKTPEELQELVALRNKLHKETYYDPLTLNRPTTEKEIQEAQEAQETPQQKMERLAMEDEKKKREEEEKKKPIAVARAQESAERFRGSSG